MTNGEAIVKYMSTWLTSSCGQTLYEYKNGNNEQTLPLITNYNPGTMILTRGQSTCPSHINEVTKSRGHATTSLK